MGQNLEPKDEIRLKTTAIIWGAAVGMMVFSIPLAAITESALIPLAVIVGASVGTCGVWFRSNKSHDNKAELAAEQRLKELEERLANLETINNFERRLAEESLKRADAISAGQVMPDQQNEITIESQTRFLSAGN